MLPQNILDEFTRIPQDTSVEDYYGVYNMILSQVAFPGQFIIRPLFPIILRNPPGVEKIDYVVTFLVGHGNQPVFFLEIKPPGDLQKASKRTQADKEMRDRFHSLRDSSPTPRLHGISVMGQRLAFYVLDKPANEVRPHYIEPLDEHVNDTVPVERWDLDITNEDGYQAFMEAVQDTRNMLNV